MVLSTASSGYGCLSLHTTINGQKDENSFFFSCWGIKFRLRYVLNLSVYLYFILKHAKGRDPFFSSIVGSRQWTKNGDHGSKPKEGILIWVFNFLIDSN